MCNNPCKQKLYSSFKCNCLFYHKSIFHQINEITQFWDALFNLKWFHQNIISHKSFLDILTSLNYTSIINKNVYMQSISSRYAYLIQICDFMTSVVPYIIKEVLCMTQEFFPTRKSMWLKIPTHTSRQTERKVMLLEMVYSLEM